MNRKFYYIGAITLVILAAFLLLNQKLHRAKHIGTVIEEIYTTSYEEYPDHWMIYKEKRKYFEPYFTKEAYDNFGFDQMITDAMSMFYNLESDSKVDSIKFKFKSSGVKNKLSCSFKAYIDLDYLKSDFTSDPVEMEGVATLRKEDGEWKIDYIKMTKSNIFDYYYKKKQYDSKKEFDNKTDED